MIGAILEAGLLLFVGWKHIRKDTVIILLGLLLNVVLLILTEYPKEVCRYQFVLFPFLMAAEVFVGTVLVSRF